MKWTDVFDIAIELSDQFPDTDPIRQFRRSEEMGAGAG